MKLKKLTAIITMLGLSALALSACSGTTQAAAPAEAAAVESTVESTATTEMEPAEEAAQPTDESAVAEALKEEVAADSMYVLHQERVASPEWVTKLPVAQDENVKQLFVVAGLGMDKTTASISMHERSVDGKWEQILSTPGFVGKNGLCLDADHKEGCGQTPVGVYKFNKGDSVHPGNRRHLLVGRYSRRIPLQ